MMQRPWLKGWKQIAAYCGVHPQTAQKYAKKYHMTIYRLPGGTPVALPSQLDLWLVKMNEACENRNRKES